MASGSKYDWPAKVVVPVVIAVLGLAGVVIAANINNDNASVAQQQSNLHDVPGLVV